MFFGPDGLKTVGDHKAPDSLACSGCAAIQFHFDMRYNLFKQSAIAAILSLGAMAVHPAMGQSQDSKAAHAVGKRVLSNFDIRDSAPLEGPSSLAQEQA